MFFRFQYAIPFSDKDGHLRLSSKQKASFYKWCRPEEISGEPKMILSHGMDFHSIKQTVSLNQLYNIKFRYSDFVVDFLLGFR